MKLKVPELTPDPAARIRKLNFKILTDVPCIDIDNDFLNQFLARATLSFEGHVPSLVTQSLLQIL